MNLNVNKKIYGEGSRTPPLPKRWRRIDSEGQIELKTVLEKKEEGDRAIAHKYTSGYSVPL